jgi:hypothetical protein
MRQRFAGSGVFLGTAGFFVVIGLLALLLEIQSPSWVQWSGIKVHGVTRNGVTYYHYGGERYVVDNPHAGARDSFPDTVVWLSRSDPQDESKAYVANAWDRWLDLGAIAIWFVAALAFALVGLVRSRLRRRRRIETMGQFGSGLSDEVVRRILAERRAREPRGRVPITGDD